MRVIYKYPINIGHGAITVVPVPDTSQVLHIDSQAENPRMWVLLDDTHTLVGGRKFYVFGTGRPIPDGLKLFHVGTMLHQDGSLVWHCFEEFT